MSELYARNTLENFWGLVDPVPRQTWLPEARALLADLGVPGSSEVDGTWEQLIAFILGEEQFGPDRYRLGTATRLYYQLKPYLPRFLTALLRQGYRSRQAQRFPLNWPTEERFIRFLYQVRDLALAQDSQRDSSPASAGWWPDDASFSFVLTHDVEKTAGHDYVRHIADLEERYGFRSSFNFVPEGYPVSSALLTELRDRGFEVGVHGLVHDGRLFASRTLFDQRARAINRYLHEWGAVGFRAPLTHRNPEWLQALEIDYDLSFFDTDPFEPMPGGTMTIWPFFCGRFVELPYTLAQDYTLFVVAREAQPKLWLQKVGFIAQLGGMVLLNAHPDYLRIPAYYAAYEDFLRHMAQGQWTRAKPGVSAGSPAPDTYWHALPRDVAHWWRKRHDELTARGIGEPSVSIG